MWLFFGDDDNDDQHLTSLEAFAYQESLSEPVLSSCNLFNWHLENLFAFPLGLRFPKSADDDNGDDDKPVESVIGGGNSFDFGSLS